MIKEHQIGKVELLKFTVEYFSKRNRILKKNRQKEYTEFMRNMPVRPPNSLKYILKKFTLGNIHKSSYYYILEKMKVLGYDGPDLEFIYKSKKQDEQKILYLTPEFLKQNKYL